MPSTFLGKLVFQVVFAARLNQGLNMLRSEKELSGAGEYWRQLYSLSESQEGRDWVLITMKKVSPVFTIMNQSRMLVVLFY